MSKKYGSLIKLICVLVVVCLTSTPLIEPQTTSAEDDWQDVSCIRDNVTSKAICGTFLVYWQQHGGAVSLGRPLSNLLVEVTGNGIQTLNVREAQYFGNAILVATDTNSTLEQISQFTATASTFKQRYPQGDPSQFIEAPPLPERAANISTERDYHPATWVGTVTTYTTYLSTSDLYNFYTGILTKHGWKCNISCEGLSKASKLEDQTIWIDWVQVSALSKADYGTDYNFDIYIKEITPSKRQVVLSVFSGSPREIPPIFHTSPPTIGIGMPKAGYIDRQPYILASIAGTLIMCGLALRADCRLCRQ